jgi:Rap1a immunity proteins
MKYLITAVMMIVVMNVIAQPFDSGIDLKGFCDAPEPEGHFMKKAECRGYVSGVFDMNEGNSFCAPAGITQPQVIEIVKKYLNSHTEKLDNSAASLALAALNEAFPCR